MRVGVLSDIHDHLWALDAALQLLHDKADVLLCCGDLCSPFVIDELARFPGAVHIVFGNNDADLFRITSKAAKYPSLTLHGEFMSAVFGGKRIAMQHFDNLARPLARSGEFDAVCFGHNHQFEISRVQDCLLLNPGCLLGAQFGNGRREACRRTVLVYDTERHAATRFDVEA